jgi:hypothetical protein
LTHDESDAQEQSCSEIPPFLPIFHIQLSEAAHNAQHITHTHTYIMESAQQATLSKATGTPSAAISNFRVGENNSFDESDSDQSAHSERSLSPSRSGAKKSIAKKRKERKQVGALTDELGTLLGAAFQTPTADSVQHDAPSGM